MPKSKNQNSTLRRDLLAEESQSSKAARLEALRATRLLDSPVEVEFDRITRLATRALDAPAAAITLLAEDRDFFKSSVGFPEPYASKREAPSSHSFCRHVVARDGPIIIEDARNHPLVCDNPAVRDLGVAAYLGVPIHAPSGEAIASLCVIDHRPRQWTAEDLEAVQDLAAATATEIALRQQVRESRELAERLDYFINASPAALYISDIVEKRLLFTTSDLAILLGSTAKEVNEKGLGFRYDAVHPDDRRAFMEHIEGLRTLADGETASFEYRLRQPDGTWHWIMSRDTALHRDETGAVREVIGSAMDITDRKRAEEALRESEDRLEMAMRGANIGMWHWDIVTDYVTYDRRWAEMLGYELEEIAPSFSEWETRVHPDDKARVLSAIEAHAKGLTSFFAVEHRLRAKDGTWRWILTSGKTYDSDPEGHPRRAAGIHLDITARKEAEAASREADRKLARILESMDEACSAADSEFRYTFVNPSWEKMFGRRKEEVIGRTIWEVFPQVHGSVIDEKVREALEKRIPVRYEVLSPVVHRWFQVRIFPASDGGINTFCLDIHERKMAEEELRDIDRRKDEFIAMLGHELRNPLAAIRHALGLCDSTEEPEVFEWAKAVVDRQSAHLASLVHDLLDVSRITQGKVELHKRRLDLAVVLDQAIEEMRPSITERGHELRESYEHDVLWVDGDPARLEQIFSNLLNNAAKYTNPGGRIWVEARRVPRSGTPGEQEVVISVRDTGMGIVPSKLPAMFELFVQGERSLARTEGGLGLGLPIVKAMAEMHGGHATAHSEGIEKGSTFTVSLPLAAAPSPEKKPKPVPPGPPLSVAHRVLVVDDVADTANGLARLLRKQGHTVEVATDGAEACKQAHRFAPEVVLLDIGMPGMDGYEVARHLRSDDTCANMLLVALTGYGQDEDRRRALEAGFDEHLVKPIDFERLKELIVTAPHTGND